MASKNEQTELVDGSLNHKSSRLDLRAYRRLHGVLECVRCFKIMPFGPLTMSQLAQERPSLRNDHLYFRLLKDRFVV